MRVSQRHGGQLQPVRPLRVVVFDGSAHYDGTVATTRVVSAA